ncbi:MAG: hypothetical protein ACFB15_15065 [Cyclobacteriaceae bacterium]
MKHLLILLAVAVLLASCHEDHSDLIPGQDFIPDEILEEIKANGQPIFEGLNPPDVTGRYRVSPMELVSSNFTDNNRPAFFFDEIVDFNGLNQGELTLEVASENGGTLGEGFGSFISGSGQKFTIYVRIDRIDEKGHMTLDTRLYSGTLTDGGIVNLYTSFFMIDDGGDPDGDSIENGQGRLFKDGNGFSEKM